MHSKPRPRRGRKLLVASLGVATLSFTGACGSNHTSVANLAPPPSCDVAPNDPSCIGRHDAGSDGASGDAPASPDATTDGTGVG